MTTLRGGLTQPSPSSSSPVWVALPAATANQPALPAGTFVFRQPTGNSVALVLPPSSATAVSWATFRGQQDGFSIDYLTTWTKVEETHDGHEGFVVYPPGTASSQDIPGGAKGISVGWSSTFTPPADDDPTVTRLGPVASGETAGQLFTTGALGKSITAAFPRSGGHLLIVVNLSGVTTAAQDQDLLLVATFQHMLTSLRFL